MNSGDPSPMFDDIAADRRSDEQKAMDGRTAKVQVGFFDANAKTPPDPYGDLINLLGTRRDGNGPGVQFSQAGSADSESRPLVVPDELLLPVEAGDQDDAMVLLRDRNYAKQENVARGFDAPELDARLMRFRLSTPPGDGLHGPTDVAGVAGDVGPTLDLLNKDRSADQPKATYVAVVAFQGHHHPGGDVVVKLADGPSPTLVENGVAPADGQSEIQIAVIDTGIGRLAHGDGWFDAIPRVENSIDLLDAFPENESPTVPGNGYLDFAAGHGTFVAGVIQSVEPAANIRAYAALDSDGYASEVQVAGAIIQAYKDGAQIINLSLGCHTVDNQPPTAIQAALDVISEDCEANQKEPPVIVAAAGNFGDDVLVFPAACKNVIPVSALNADHSPAAWSSHGSWIDGGFATVGEGIVAPYVVGIRDDAFGGQIFPFPGWAMWTGTSFAAPQISGAIARIARRDGVTPSASVETLKSSADPIEGYGVPVWLLPGTPLPPTS